MIIIFTSWINSVIELIQSDWNELLNF